MNVPTMTLPIDEAKVAYKEYRQAVRDNPGSTSDRALMLGYRALAKGQAIIDINEALRAGGQDEQGRPRFVFGRANWEWCWLRMNWDGGGRFSNAEFLRGRSYPSRVFRFPDGTFPARQSIRGARAMVPTIPPRFRPATGKLGDYSILWEAEWKPVPPVDPMLLRHLHGPLYAVLAVWDLTPLERSVLGAMRLEARP